MSKFSYKVLNDFYKGLNNEDKEKFDAIVRLHSPMFEGEARDLIFHFVRIKDFTKEQIEMSYINIFKLISINRT